MMCKYKVLLIENQFFQYKRISKNLSNFIVLPEEKDFVEIIDCVRIYLTERYDSNSSIIKDQRRQKAIKYLIDYINNNDIDVILIDYVLVGHTPDKRLEALDGIDLAKKLKDENIKIPIIFLSRYSENDKKIKNKLEKNKIKNYNWVEKGYAGQGIGDDWYFKTNVVNKIKEIIGLSVGVEGVDEEKNSEEFSDLVNRILQNKKVKASDLFEKLKKILLTLESTVSSDVFKILKDAADNPNDMDEEKIKELINCLNRK